MNFHPRSDNVLLELEPLPTQTTGGLHIPDMGKKDARRKATAVRWARVLAVGPGHQPGCKKCGDRRRVFIPTELRPGQRVLVDALAGQDYSWDIVPTRAHAKAQNFEAVGDHRGELRVVREDECIAVDEDAQPDTVRDGGIQHVHV